MPMLKYSTYQNLINSSLSKEELEDLIKTIYVISLACLKQKYNNKSDGIDLENMTIDATVSLLVRDSTGKMKITKKIIEHRNEINNEIEFNYLIFSKIAKELSKKLLRL